MARRSLSQNLPSLVKGGCTVGAVTYQSAAARAYHDEDDDAAVGGGVGRDSTVLTGGSTSNTTSGRPEEVAVHRGALKGVEHASSSFSSSSQDRQQISVKEVEEASRILFAPEGSAHRHQQHHHRHAAALSSFRESNELLSGMSARGGRGGGGGGGGGGHAEAASVEEDLASNEEGSISPLTPPMFRPRPNSTSSTSAAVAAAAAAATAATTTSSSSSASGLTRLHPQPEVHAEILRFGMALASNPKIQSAIREELEMHHVQQQQQQQLEGGREEAGEGGLDAAEATVAQMESTVRRLLRRGVAGGEEEDDDEEGREGGRGSPGSGRSSSSSFLTGSFELLGAMSAEWAQAQADEEDEEEGEEGKYDNVAENLPSNSFVSVGRNMRRKDSLAGEVSEEVLDELLRGDDDDDVITQKLFAETPDEQVRRYLRNLDLECVICCEYMVECKAVDCGEGHTFCGECIERWLGREREGGHGGGRCPTCQKPCGKTLIPMRQYDAMIEKYVRASNLWDEQCSFYRRRTLAHMRRELERQDREEDEAAAAAAAAAAAGGSQNPFVGLGKLLFGLGGPSGAAATRRRRRSRQAAADAAAAAAATATAGEGGREGGAEDAAEPWWRSEVLSTALSVATMLVLLVLFKRGIKIR